MASYQREQVGLSQAASYLLDESRMVLPGIQATFGFQLIAILNSRFTDLEALEQRLHFLSLTLVAIAIALVMTPAAYHRITGVTHVSTRFLATSSRLLLVGMAFLAVGISVDYYVVGVLVFGHRGVAIAAAILLGAFTGLWFLFPRSRRRHPAAT
jgi:hypothetical protein